MHSRPAPDPAAWLRPALDERRARRRRCPSQRRRQPNPSAGRAPGAGGGRFHYLGPAIAAHEEQPVRILFRNLLPSGTGGNLFLPVDTTVMGSGIGPTWAGWRNPDPRNPMCGWSRSPRGCYTENRAHARTARRHHPVDQRRHTAPVDHARPASRPPYPKGVSVQERPGYAGSRPGGDDVLLHESAERAAHVLPRPRVGHHPPQRVRGRGRAATFIKDPTEQRSSIRDVLPVNQLPLVIQDKTFVPSTDQLAQSPTPLWDVARWGGVGSLWVPHVYVPAQNPGDQLAA